MNGSTTKAQGMVRARRKWWVLCIGGVVCVLSWTAVGLAIAFEAEFTTKVVLVTLAAASSEGLIWLAALVLGIRVFEIRRGLMQRLRAMVGAGRVRK